MAELEQCTAEQVVDVVEAVTVAASACTVLQITQHVNHPDASVKNALAVATQLGLLKKDGQKYAATHPYEHYFAEASESRRIDVLRFALEAFAPYRFFKQRLAFHGDPLRAARETKLRFAFENHESEIRETLVSLGQFSGSLSYATETGYGVSRSSAVEEFLAIADTISIERAAVEDFIRERLGSDAYAYIQDEQEDIVTHVRIALAKVIAGELDEGAVMHVANACENFLVKVASGQTPPVDLSDKNGIIQSTRFAAERRARRQAHGVHRLPRTPPQRGGSRHRS